MANVVFGIDGEILKSVLSQALKAGEAVFQTAAAGGMFNAPCDVKVKSPLYIRTAKKFVEVKILGEDFTASAKIAAGNGLRIDGEGEMIISAKVANILCRFVLSEGFYEFGEVTNGEIAITGSGEKDTLGSKATFPVIEDKLLRETFSREIPDVSEEVTIPAASFGRLVAQSAYAVDEKHTKINVLCSDGNLTLTGLTKSRLATASKKLDEVTGNLNCFVSAAAVRFVAAIARDVAFAYDSAEDEVQFAAGDYWRVYAKNFACTYPNLAPLFDVTAPVVATINRKELLTALKFCKLVDDYRKAVKLVFGNDNDLLVCAESEDYSAKRLLQVESSGTSFGNAEIQLNLNFLTDTLKAISTNTITMSLTKNGAAILPAVGGAFAFIAAYGGVKLPARVKALPQLTTETIDITPAVEELVTVA